MNRIRTVKLAVLLVFSPILMILLFSVTVFAQPVGLPPADVPPGPSASLPAGPPAFLGVVPPAGVPVGPPADLSVGPPLLGVMPGVNPFLDTQNPPPVLLVPGLNQ